MKDNRKEKENTWIVRCAPVGVSELDGRPALSVQSQEERLERRNATGKFYSLENLSTSQS